MWKHRKSIPKKTTVCRWTSQHRSISEMLRGCQCTRVKWLDPICLIHFLPAISWFQRIGFTECRDSFGCDQPWFLWEYSNCVWPGLAHFLDCRLAYDGKQMAEFKSMKIVSVWSSFGFSVVWFGATKILWGQCVHHRFCSKTQIHDSNEPITNETSYGLTIPVETCSAWRELIPMHSKNQHKPIVDELLLTVTTHIWISKTVVKKTRSHQASSSILQMTVIKCYLMYRCYLFWWPLKMW